MCNVYENAPGVWAFASYNFPLHRCAVSPHQIWNEEREKGELQSVANRCGIARAVFLNFPLTLQSRNSSRYAWQMLRPAQRNLFLSSKATSFVHLTVTNGPNKETVRRTCQQPVRSRCGKLQLPVSVRCMAHDEFAIENATGTTRVNSHSRTINRTQ